MSVFERRAEGGAVRAEAVVATTGAGMLVAAVAGALLLFAPSGGGTGGGAGAAPSTAAPATSESVDAPAGATPEDGPETGRSVPRGTVATVPPAPAPTPTAHPAQRAAKPPNG